MCGDCKAQSWDRCSVLLIGSRRGSATRLPQLPAPCLMPELQRRATYQPTCEVLHTGELQSENNSMSLTCLQQDTFYRVPIFRKERHLSFCDVHCSLWSGSKVLTAHLSPQQGCNMPCFHRMICHDCLGVYAHSLSLSFC